MGLEKAVEFGRLNTGMTAAKHVSSATSLVVSDNHVVLADASSAAFTINLPDANEAIGHEFIIVDVGATGAATNNITIEDYDTNTVFTINTDGEAVLCKSYGSGWIALKHLAT